MSETRPSPKSPQERVIVALDVSSMREALQIVSELEGLITFYKVGLELLMSGEMTNLLKELVRGKKVFVDLKLPSDIPETVGRVVSLASEMGVTFMTLSSTATAGTFRAAVAGRGKRSSPQLLFVSYLSSLDRVDFAEIHNRRPEEFEAYLEQRTQSVKDAGADGFIVSGREIGLLRAKYPDATLVSPGIRPSGAPADDHKRTCTPAEAIRLGADYIVVGRPIRNSSDRKAAAQSIIDEIAQTESASAKSSNLSWSSESSDYGQSASVMLARSRTD
jgi:orotidine-5'-phosphate decarboxylase